MPMLLTIFVTTTIPKSALMEELSPGGTRMAIRKIQIVMSLLALTASLLLAVPSFAGSQVRIVRLSDVEGLVQINRNTRSFEKAFLNLPVTQGNQVRTLNDGRAVIEFEEGIALRMAPDTTSEFLQLSLDDSGKRVSNVRLQSGELYVEFKDPKNDRFTLSFGREMIVFTQPAHLRVTVADENVAVVVFSGEVDVENPSGKVQVAKNRTAIFNLAGGNDSSKVAKDIEPEPYDAWDKQQDRYQQRYSNDLVASSSPYSYGTADLSYYGTYFNAPGYGLVWQPYFAGAGWNPFMDGAWALYPGAGYGWVSAYPWGWTPYHSGSWAFIPGRGWAWQPGGTWMAVTAYPRVLNAPANFVAPKPPAMAGQSVVVVSRNASSMFAGKSTSKVVIRNDSAGLGIPRGEVNNLAQISERVNTQGAVTAKVHAAPVQTETITSGSQTWPRANSAGFPSSYPTRGTSAGMSHPAGSAVHSAPTGHGRN